MNVNICKSSDSVLENHSLAWILIAERSSGTMINEPGLVTDDQRISRRVVVVHC